VVIDSLSLLAWKAGAIGPGVLWCIWIAQLGASPNFNHDGVSTSLRLRGLCGCPPPWEPSIVDFRHIRRSVLVDDEGGRCAGQLCRFFLRDRHLRRRPPSNERFAHRPVRGPECRGQAIPDISTTSAQFQVLDPNRFTVMSPDLLPQWAGAPLRGSAPRQGRPATEGSGVCRCRCCR
jgi:hypothetical protein